MLSQNAGSFYTRAASEILIDPFVSPPLMQNQMTAELSHCEDLVRRDYRYAHLVAGASKMPMNMIWVARNQSEDVSDRDLETLKDVAWNEFVKKRFLPSVTEGTPVSEVASSMLEIVRSMNLQRRRFQIMGLHEQVEASELQLIIHLCQAGLLNTSEYRVAAIRFRRHDKFFEAFALAVGAFVCASAPFTLGVATTQFNRSLQYDYKMQTIALFVYVLKQNRALVNQGVGLDEDYVCRISRLIIVSQDTGVVPGLPESSTDRKDDFMRSAIQHTADRVDRLAAQVEQGLAKPPSGDGGNVAKIRADFQEKLREMHAKNTQALDEMKRINGGMRETMVAHNAAIDARFREMREENRKSRAEANEDANSNAGALRAAFNSSTETLYSDMERHRLEFQKSVLDVKGEMMQKQVTLNETVGRLTDQMRTLGEQLRHDHQVFMGQVKVEVGNLDARMSGAAAVPVTQMIQAPPVAAVHVITNDQIAAQVHDFIKQKWGEILPSLHANVRREVNSITDAMMRTKIETILNEAVPDLQQLAAMAKSHIPTLITHGTTTTAEITEFKQQLQRLQTGLDGNTKKIDEVHVEQNGMRDELRNLSQEIIVLKSDIASYEETLSDRILDITVGGSGSDHETQILSKRIKEIATEEINSQMSQPTFVSSITAEVLRDPKFVDQVADISGERISRRVDVLEQYNRIHQNTAPGFPETFTKMPTDDAQY